MELVLKVPDYVSPMPSACALLLSRSPHNVGERLS